MPLSCQTDSSDRGPYVALFAGFSTYLPSETIVKKRIEKEQAMRIPVVASLLLCLAGSSGSAVEPITTGFLVAEMAELVRLADFAQPAYTTVQFSSYDRRSKAPNTPGWYANSDGFGSEPIPGFLRVLNPPGADGVGEYVMAEVSGPGAVVRGWTAAIGGEIRVFLDGDEKPVFDGPANVFLSDRYAYYAQKVGLPVEEAGDAFHQNDADYFPLPFARSCRVVWKGKVSELHFYHIQIRKYHPAAPVQTFRPADLKTYSQEIRRAIAILRSPARSLDEAPVMQKISLDLAVGPGEEVQAMSTEKGPGAVRNLALKVEGDELRTALRQTLLCIRFDGSPRPQVEAPVGDFFGAAPGINPYETLPMTVSPDGTMSCRFVMPFARSVSLTFDNRGEKPVRIGGEVLLSPYNWQPDRSMHFRARWRVNHDLVAASGENAFDVPFLVAHGQGVYVGTAAILMNPSPVPTAYGNWWGEGDEKVFVDGEDSPSTFGTGSEDYFNYSWSRCDLFDHPYCAQPLCTGPDTRGYVSNCRWHVLDALPFEQEIAFYIELYSHRRTAGLSYARIAYHYARPGIRDDCVPVMSSDARIAPLPEAWQPVASHGAAGATFYQAESLKAEGDGEVSIAEGELWSGGKLLVWRPQKKGDTLSLTLQVPKKGRYAIVMTAAMSPNSGRFQARCDGQQLLREGDATTVDLRAPHQTMLRNFPWNPLALDAGTHVIVLETPEDNPSGSSIGLDFIWLHPRR